MSATEEDTELRDLLVQNLESSGVLNKIKAEMRAAVFLAMEEQDRLQSKTPLINENLRKSLSSRDGRLVASLVLDFLRVFSLDFTLSVFQPEINALNGLDSRDLVCKDLSLSESETNKNCPLLLELVRRGHYRDGPAGGDKEDSNKGTVPQDVSQRQISQARSKFDLYDEGLSGSINKEDVKNVFADLFPTWNKRMLENFINDELRAADTHTDVDFQLFLNIYRRFYCQCRAVVVQDCDVSPPEETCPSLVTQDPPVCKDVQQASHPRASSSSGGPRKEQLDLDLDLDDPDDGDSFFDDPLPKPQKTYGCPDPVGEDGVSGPLVSPMRRGQSLSDLSVIPVDSEVDGDVQGSELRTADGSGSRLSPAGSLSEGPRVQGGRGGAGGRSSVSEPSLSKDDEDIQYDDDFNSHRSDLSRSELSIGEEIEEVSIQGPDHSQKSDETQDFSLSQISQNLGVDYMEDVS